MSEDQNSELVAEETELPEDEEALPAPTYEIFSYPADTTLRGYLDQWNNEQLFIPAFQRQYVWDQTRASKLIESFLLGLPVPPVFLYKPTSTKAFWIIDGHQRIRSVVDFQKGLFGEGKFRLKGVDDRWARKSFADLTENDRFALETAVLRAVVIQQTNPKDHTSIYHIFERLNTGGVRLNAMEVRQCVFESKFLEELQTLNSLDEWRKLIGLPRPDKRIKDVELLLRIIALYRNYENYEKPMKSFLNECASHFKERHSQNDFAEQKEIIETAKSAIKSAYNTIGEKPFHLRGRLNFSALDATLVALMRNRDAHDISSRFQALIANEDFLESVSYDTSDESVLKKRINVAMTILG